MMITVTVNGIAMSSKEIPEVRGTGHIYTAPKLGYPPAVGVIRDLTIRDSDSGEWIIVIIPNKIMYREEFWKYFCIFSSDRSYRSTNY